MAKKSEFLKAFGTAMEIFRAMTNAVLERGGNDEDIRRILVSKKLLAGIADLIVENGRRVAENVFRIFCEGNRTVTELVRLGRYDWSNDLITGGHFPLGKHESEERTIELVKLDYEPSSEDVLREFDRRGLARPQTEDALYFGILCPKEQRKHPIVFLHEPVFGPGGGCRVLVLDGSVSGRSLYLDWFGGRWSRDCAFAGIRKQHSCLGS